MRREIAPLLERLAEGLSGILGSNLVGLYVYGSALGDTFDPARSDLDCIAVTEEPLTEVEFADLANWFAVAGQEDPWVERLQMSFLIRRTVLDDDPAACLFQYGRMKRSGSDGNPLIWLDFFQHGCVLHGPEPQSFLPKITPESFREALAREVGYLREELNVKPDGEWRDRVSYRVYAVLTLCRILHSARTGHITSKPEAGKWALGRVPGDWHTLIRSALANAAALGLEDIPLEPIRSFIGHVQASVDSEPLIDPVSPRNF